MESRMSWCIKNPSFYLGAVLFLIFGSQCVMGYIKEHQFYVLESILSIIGVFMIVLTVKQKLAHHSSKST
jgi:putative Mn2+ efflux pump MntP